MAVDFRDEAPAILKDYLIYKADNQKYVEENR